MAVAKEACASPLLVLRHHSLFCKEEVSVGRGRDREERQGRGEGEENSGEGKGKYLQVCGSHEQQSLQ